MTVSTTQPAAAPGDEMETEANQEQRAPAAARNGAGRDRRRSYRVEQAAIPGIGAVTLYPRDPAELLNISSSGLLVSCSRRLMPDTPAKFVLQCDNDEDLVVTGRVVRSKLVAAGGGGGIAYETAIRADTEMDLERYGATIPPPPPPDTRRGHERVPGPFDGTCVTPNGEMSIKVSGLSDGGCFIAQPNTVSQGDQLNLEIHVPTGDPIVTAAEVVTVDPDEGFAVVFQDANRLESEPRPSTTEHAAPAGAGLTGASMRPHDALARTDTHTNDW
jgi:hypothetical protein